MYATLGTAHSVCILVHLGTPGPKQCAAHHISHICMCPIHQIEWVCFAKYVQYVNLVHLGSTRFQPVWYTRQIIHTRDTPCVHKVHRAYQINYIHQIHHVYTRHTRSGIFAEYSLVCQLGTPGSNQFGTNTPVVQHWLMITTHTDNTPVHEEHTVWSPPFKTLLTRRCEGGEGRRWGCQGD